MKKLIYTIILISFIGCTDRKSKREWTNDDTILNEDTSLPSLSSESNPTHDNTPKNKSVIEDNLQKLESGVNQINSPDKLIENIQDYEIQLSHISNAISHTKDHDEKLKLESEYTQIKEEFTKKVKENSLPANGIIQNIKVQMDRVDKCSSAQDMHRILDTHYAYFKNLSKLHLIVEEKSRQAEVREMASKLQSNFYDKIEEFEIDFQ